jgi:hypothetical protein
MLEWLFGRKRRDEQFMLDMMRTAAEGDRLHRLRQAIATVSVEPLAGKDATEQAANAAAILTAAVASDTIGVVETDDDRFVAGTFAFVFSDYFATLLAGDFEMAACFAVMQVVGSEEFERCFNDIQSNYNDMVQSKAKVIEAIGKSCEAWFKNPNPSQFERLAELFKILRGRVVQK